MQSQVVVVGHDREFEFVRNGMDADRMKLLEMITPEKNLWDSAIANVRLFQSLLSGYDQHPIFDGDRQERSNAR